MRTGVEIKIISKQKMIGQHDNIYFVFRECVAIVTCSCDNLNKFLNEWKYINICKYNQRNLSKCGPGTHLSLFLYEY